MNVASEILYRLISFCEMYVEFTRIDLRPPTSETIKEISCTTGKLENVALTFSHDFLLLLFNVVIFALRAVE